MRDKTPTIIATTALVVAVLGATPVGQAAGKFVLGKNTVGTAQLKRNAVTGKKIADNAVTTPKVKDDSLTGADVLESSLGKVPSAASADQAASATAAVHAASATTAGHAASADTLSASEAWHEVGTPGEPAFWNGWVNFPGSNSAGFYKDRLGYVHLKGFVRFGAVPGNVFVLPAGYRPAKQLILPTVADHAFASVLIGQGGQVSTQVGSNVWFSLDGIVFPAA